MGMGEAYVAGGTESMSRVPMIGFNFLPHPGLAETYPQIYMSMGETAEHVARRYGVSRERQEAFAVTSQQHAAEAQADGRLAEEIAPVRPATGRSTGTAACGRPPPPRASRRSSPRSRPTAPSPRARPRR